MNDGIQINTGLLRHMTGFKMGKIIAYIRLFTGKQGLSHQKLAILECVRNKNLKVDELL